MRGMNPVYIPRNHRVEQALSAAEKEGDFSLFHKLRQILNNPFSEQAGAEDYAMPPAPDERVLATFCGT